MPYVNNGQWDASALFAMGYDQELERGFRNSAMTGAYCFVVIGTVPFVWLDVVLGLGGTSTMLGSWIVVTFFTALTTLCLGEIVSAFPNTGAMYHWVGMLSPPEWAPVLSYGTGMLLLVGRLFSVTSSLFSTTKWISELIVFCTAGSPLTAAQSFGTSFAILLSWFMFNVLRSRTLARCFLAFALFYIAFAIGIGATLYSVNAPSGKQINDMWSSWANDSGFMGVDGYVALLSVPNGMLYALSDYEASAHLAEETIGANYAVPVGTLVAVLLSGICGMWLLITMFAYLPADISSSVSSSTTDGLGSLHLAFEMFSTALDPSPFKNEAVLVVAILMLAMLWMCGAAVMTAASRMLFGLGRDRAVPFSRICRYLHPHSSSPLGATLVTALCTACLLLFSLASDFGLVSLTNSYYVLLQIAYAVPIVLRLSLAHNAFRPGPFNLGRLSIPIAWVSLTWLLFSTALCFWPAQAPTATSNMNWNCVIVVGIGFILTAYWLVHLRYSYKGPRIRHGDLSVHGPVGRSRYPRKRLFSFMAASTRVLPIMPVVSPSTRRINGSVESTVVAAQPGQPPTDVVANPEPPDLLPFSSRGLVDDGTHYSSHPPVERTNSSVPGHTSLSDIPLAPG